MSLDLEKIKKTKTSKLGFFRFKKFDEDTYLITNDAGKFEFLSIEEFDKFISCDFENFPKYESLLGQGFIKDDFYEQKMIRAVALKNHFVGVGPTLHILVTTLRCNHHCKYCHAAVAPLTAKGLDMTMETAKKVVDTIFYTNSDNIQIEFQGGESLLNFDVIKYVVNYSRELANNLNKNLSFIMVTNLTLMTEEKLKWLMDNYVDICTSLDGDKFNHNNNRTGFDGNSFERVTYWINRINQERNKRKLGNIGALLTVTKENLPHYKNIINSYIDLGLNGIFLRWLNPYGFTAGNMKSLSYTSEEWIDFYTKSMDYIIDINKKGINFSEYITRVYLLKIFAERDPAFPDLRSPSGIAIGAVAYNYDGKVYASDESRVLGRMGIDDFLMSDMKDSGEETYMSMMNSDVTKISIQSSCLDGLPGYNDHVYKPYLGVDIIHNFKITCTLYTPLAKDEKMQIQIAILDYIFNKLRDPEIKKIFLSWI